MHYLHLQNRELARLKEEVKQHKGELTIASQVSQTPPWYSDGLHGGPPAAFSSSFPPLLHPPVISGVKHESSVSFPAGPIARGNLGVDGSGREGSSRPSGFRAREAWMSIDTSREDSLGNGSKKYVPPYTSTPSSQGEYRSFAPFLPTPIPSRPSVEPVRDRPFFSGPLYSVAAAPSSSAALATMRGEMQERSHPPPPSHAVWDTTAVGMESGRDKKVGEGGSGGSLPLPPPTPPTPYGEDVDGSVYRVPNLSHDTIPHRTPFSRPLPPADTTGASFSSWPIGRGGGGGGMASSKWLPPPSPTVPEGSMTEEKPSDAHPLLFSADGREDSHAPRFPDPTSTAWSTAPPLAPSPFPPPLVPNWSFTDAKMGGTQGLGSVRGSEDGEGRRRSGEDGAAVVRSAPEDDGMTRSGERDSLLPSGGPTAGLPAVGVPLGDGDDRSAAGPLSLGPTDAQGHLAPWRASSEVAVEHSRGTLLVPPALLSPSLVGNPTAAVQAPSPPSPASQAASGVDPTPLPPPNVYITLSGVAHSPTSPSHPAASPSLLLPFTSGGGGGSSSGMHSSTQRRPWTCAVYAPEDPRAPLPSGSTEGVGPTRNEGATSPSSSSSGAAAAPSGGGGAPRWGEGGAALASGSRPMVGEGDVLPRPYETAAAGPPSPPVSLLGGLQEPPHRIGDAEGEMAHSTGGAPEEERVERPPNGNEEDQGEKGERAPPPPPPPPMADANPPIGSPQTVAKKPVAVLSSVQVVLPSGTPATAMPTSPPPPLSSRSKKGASLPEVTPIVSPSRDAALPQSQIPCTPSGHGTRPSVVPVVGEPMEGGSGKEMGSLAAPGRTIRGSDQPMEETAAFPDWAGVLPSVDPHAGSTFFPTEGHPTSGGGVAATPAPGKETNGGTTPPAPVSLLPPIPIAKGPLWESGGGDHTPASGGGSHLQRGVPTVTAVENPTSRPHARTTSTTFGPPGTASAPYTSVRPFDDPGVTFPIPPSDAAPFGGEPNGKKDQLTCGCCDCCDDCCGDCGGSWEHFWDRVCTALRGFFSCCCTES